MDTSKLSQSLRDKILNQSETRLGSTVEYVDVTDKSQFVPMPDWFSELTTLPGIPFKYIIEFVGKPDSGKTTAGIIALINAQKEDIVTILVDAERKFSYSRFQSMGGNPDELFIIQKPTIESSFNELEKVLKVIHAEEPGKKVLVLYDSIAVGVTAAELEKEATDPQTMADQAKVIKRMIRRMVYYIEQCSTALILINQMYANIGLLARGGSKASGGQGVEYGKALSISFTRTKELTKVKDKQEYKIGILSQLQVNKNHLLQGDMALKKMEVKILSDKVEKFTKPSKKKGEDNDELNIDDDSE